MSEPRFILLLEDGSDPDRNARRVTVGIAETVQGIKDFLNDEQVWDEDLSDAIQATGAEPTYEDGLRPALEYLLSVEGEETLEALVASLAVAWPVKIEMESGTFEIVRDE